MQKKRSAAETLKPEKVSVYGVEYNHFKTKQGDLYVTNEGMRYLKHVRPESWYVGGRYAREGTQLGRVTVTCRYRSQPKDARFGVDLVVKWSRVGNELSTAHMPAKPLVPANVIEGARFCSPFEEFGLVREVAQGDFGPPDIKIKTQTPLAIFAPNRLAEDRHMLGRTHEEFEDAVTRLKEYGHPGDDMPVELELLKSYAVLYKWLPGEDAHELAKKGVISSAESRDLLGRAFRELEAKGFWMIDIKPQHIILEQRKGSVVTDEFGRPAYGLCDFELFERTLPYATHRIEQRRHQYLLDLIHPEPAPIPSNLKTAEVFGVPYLWEADLLGGGRDLWVVGNNPDIIDFFRPGKWANQTADQISLTPLASHRRTDDGIHIVCEESLVGRRPFLGGREMTDEDGDDASLEIQAHGYNSPYEEVAIAWELRKRGISTIHPRAIYVQPRAVNAPQHPQDSSRYISHASIQTPNGQQILRPENEHVIIWGYWRGIDPIEGARGRHQWGYIDMALARDEGLLPEQEWCDLYGGAQEEMGSLGYGEGKMGADKILLSFTRKGNLRRHRGRPLLTVSLNAWEAQKRGSLGHDEYHRLHDRETERLREAGFVNLSQDGHHLLLTHDLGQGFRKNRQNEFIATHCLFNQFMRLP